MKLYICEKPSQGRDIAKIVGAFKKFDCYIEGNNLKVTWCLGHLLELAPPVTYEPNLKPWRLEILPIIPQKWQLYPKKETEKQLNAIETLLKEATEVVLATDADREGDVIGRELLDYFNYQGKVSRLWLSALDDTSIKRALADIRPGESTYPLYQSGLGRQRADWVVGMNMSIATTCLYSQGQGVLSVGRVQTPTLNLVVMRDREIENFVSQDYYVVKALFKTVGDKQFWTTWKPTDDLVDDSGRVLKKEYLDELMAKVKSAMSPEATVASFAQTRKKTKAPLCFSLSSLQKLASSKFGFSAKDTLAIAQSLYEKYKATSYPRTDCGYLPESQFNDVKEILSRLKVINPEYASLIDKANPNFKSEAWNDKKVTAHHGIIPTLNPRVDINSMTPDERKLYDLICRYYLAQFLGDYEYSNRKVEVSFINELFVASSNTPLVLGWREAINKDLEESDEEDDEANLIPELKKNELVQYMDANIDTKKTKPPARFTEGTLIDAMKNIAKYVDEKDYKKLLKETSGIGTEATRANIIELLIKREYLVRNKKQLISTEKGRQLVDLTPQMLKDPITTAKWEEILDSIAKGQANLDAFIDGQIKHLGEMLPALAKGAGYVIAKQDYFCPKCNKLMIRKRGKYGFFWSCTGFPECREIMKDQGGTPIAKAISVLTETECPKCKQGKLVKRQSKMGEFFGCSTYPNCKVIYNQLPQMVKAEQQGIPQSNS